MTLRKDKGLLEYVKVRATEQELDIDAPRSSSRGIEAIISTVPDAQDRSVLRLAVGKADEYSLGSTCKCNTQGQICEP